MRLPNYPEAFSVKIIVNCQLIHVLPVGVHAKIRQQQREADGRGRSVLIARVGQVRHGEGEREGRRQIARRTQKPRRSAGDGEVNEEERRVGRPELPCRRGGDGERAEAVDEVRQPQPQRFAYLPPVDGKYEVLELRGRALEEKAEALPQCSLW